MMNARLLTLGWILAGVGLPLAAGEHPVLLGGASLASPAAERVVLTPENAGDQGYWIRAGVGDADWGGGGDRTLEPPLKWVSFRMGLVRGGRLHPGAFAVGAKELGIIHAAALVLREGDEVILRAPLRMVIDPGNEIQLCAEFSVRREEAAKLVIEFEEQLQSGGRRLAVPLKAFLERH
mgnify:CR=1 FL=1